MLGILLKVKDKVAVPMVAQKAIEMSPVAENSRPSSL
jgi:hypothetical protein